MTAYDFERYPPQDGYHPRERGRAALLETETIPADPQGTHFRRKGGQSSPNSTVGDSGDADAREGVLACRCP